MESSANLRDWSPVLTNSDSSFARSISVPAFSDANFYRAARGGVPLFAAALTALQNITLNGNTITIDGYDSADMANFPGGVYNSSNAFAGGTVACRAGLVSIGNAKVHGQVLLGPGATFTWNLGLVGDMSWIGPGVEPPFTNWVFTNFLFCLPDVAPPYTSGFSPSPGSGTNSYILGSGDYYVRGDLRASQNLEVLGNARLYVTGNFSAAAITFQPGSSLRLFVGQTSGSPVSALISNVSSASNPGTLQVFGLPTLTNLDFGGTNAIVGAFYVPEAPVTVSGGGSVGAQIQGALVAQSIEFLGHVNLHFDVNLKRGPQR